MTAAGGGTTLTLVIRWATPVCRQLVSPLTPQERQRLSRVTFSRPGGSGWKLAFVHLYPPWIQDLFWGSLDMQRATAMVADVLEEVQQLNAPKPDGGFRPLWMLEEAAKAIDAPVTRRLAGARDAWGADDTYARSGRAYRKGVAAAPEVLYGDVMITEDARRHARHLCRVPADYEKFFNKVSGVEADAVMQARGVADCARRLYGEIFTGLLVRVSTRVGLTRAIMPERGFAQGSTSSPELSQPAQETVLRVRENSPAQYTTFSGRRVAVFSYSACWELGDCTSAPTPSP